MNTFAPTLLDAFPVGLLLTDADLRVSYVNRWLRERLAANEPELVGRLLGEAFPGLADQGLLAAYDWVRETRESLRLPDGIYQAVAPLTAKPGTGLAEVPQGTTLVPLIEAGRLTGVLTVIEDLTEQRLNERRLQREIDKLTALHAIDHALSTLDLPACLGIIIERTRALFQAENAALLLVQGDRLVVAADAGYPRSYEGESIAVTEGVSGWVVRHHAPVLVPDTRTDTRYVNVDIRIRSEMTTPLLLGEECLGALNVESRRPEAFGEADLDLLETLGARAAAALNNARLHTAEREQRALADTLRDITLTLSTELNPETILDVLLDHVARVVPYDSACIMFYETRQNRVYIGRWRGYEALGMADEAAALSVPLQSYVNLERMARSRQPAVVRNTHDDPEWVLTTLGRHIGSWAGAPIVARGQLLGFISLDKCEPDFYTAAQAQRLASFAAAAGLALENARLYAEQQRLAITDGLTGIANRRQFDLVLARELSRSRRFKRPVGLIMLDLDDFKAYNDAWGHLAGDDMLKRLALLLSQGVRAMDSVARYGGEEFAVVLPEATEADAAQVAERLRVASGQMLNGPDGRAVTISLGVAVSAEGGEAAETLIEAADGALYAAKRAGKNRSVVWPNRGAQEGATGL